MEEIPEFQVNFKYDISQGANSSHVANTVFETNNRSTWNH